MNNEKDLFTTVLTSMVKLFRLDPNILKNQVNHVVKNIFPDKWFAIFVEEHVNLNIQSSVMRYACEPAEYIDFPISADCDKFSTYSKLGN